MYYYKIMQVWQPRVHRSVGGANQYTRFIHALTRLEAGSKKKEEGTIDQKYSFVQHNHFVRHLLIVTNLLYFDGHMSSFSIQKTGSIIALLAGLAALTGYLLSRASVVGKAGISLFYKQYQFLKVWWQGGLVVFGTWMLLFLLHDLIAKKIGVGKAKVLHTMMLLLAMVGLYWTYLDFRNTLSHRMLGERFHLGGYLFWIGWMIISLLFLARKKEKPLPA